MHPVLFMVIKCSLFTFPLACDVKYLVFSRAQYQYRHMMACRVALCRKQVWQQYKYNEKMCICVGDVVICITHDTLQCSDILLTDIEGN